MVSSAQFDKAVKIVQELPKGGPVNPSEADKLFVSQHSGGAQGDYPKI